MDENQRNREIARSVQNFMNLVDKRETPWDEADDAIIGCLLAGVAGCSPEGWCWITPEGEAQKQDA